MTLSDGDGYNAGLVKAGLSPDWVELGPYSIERDFSAPHAGRKYMLYFTGFPIQNTSMIVTNPKDIVTKGLGDLPTLRSDMENSLLDIMGGNWIGGDPADAALAYSTPVFMLMEAVDSMAQAKELAQKEEAKEAEEEEERKKNFIILILSVIFMVLSIPPSPRRHTNH